jgi:hypothetical protein
MLWRNFEKLIFGGLHEKHAVQRGIWIPTQHLLWDQGKPRKTLIESSCLLFKTNLYRFVRTSQETHYVSATSPTDSCYLWVCDDVILIYLSQFWTLPVVLSFIWNTTLRILDSVSVLRWNLFSWVPNSRYRD